MAGKMTYCGTVYCTGSPVAMIYFQQVPVGWDGLTQSSCLCHLLAMVRP